ncbi:hypothetical protein [Nocardia grenadensis]
MIEVDEQMPGSGEDLAAPVGRRIDDRTGSGDAAYDGSQITGTG